MSSDRVDLEAKVTFLERTIDAMHEVVVEQGGQISRLEQRLERLEQKVAEKGEPGVGPHDSPPPHY